MLEVKIAFFWTGQLYSLKVGDRRIMMPDRQNTFSWANQTPLTSKLVLILIKTNSSYPNGRGLGIRMLRHTLLVVYPILTFFLLTGLPVLSWTAIYKGRKK